jgi:hypothetical protein
VNAVTASRHTPSELVGAPTKKRKLSKRSVKVIAWIASVGAFVLPWAVIQAIPRPAVTADPQLVVVPNGSHIVVTQAAAGGSSGVVVTSGQGGGVTTPAVATTGGSAPPPPGV